MPLHSSISYATLLCSVWLLGCSSISEQDCRYGNWQDIGFRDGAHGYDATHFSDYREACTKFAVLPDHQAWITGYHAGLQRYCRSEQAFQLGTRDAFFNVSVCPNASPLQKAYERGQRVYSIKQDIQAHQRERTKLLADAKTAIQNGQFATIREAQLYQENIRLHLNELDMQINQLKHQYQNALRWGE